MRPMFGTSIVDDESRLLHWCRMGLLGVAILHWIVFYLLTQANPLESSGATPQRQSWYAAAHPRPGQ